MQTFSVAADMRELKISGVDWCQTIPDNWSIIPSKYLFRDSNVRRLDGDIQLTASQKYGIISQVDYMEREQSAIVLANKGLESWKHVEPLDFIISLRSFQGGLEMSEVKGCITWHYVVLKATQAIHHSYYKWLFKSTQYITALQRTCNFIRDGQDLRYSNFAKVPLLYPPVEEQKTIADFLDTKCAEIDALMEDIRAEISTLGEYKRAVITEAVTKGLNPEVEMKDSGVAWVGKCPEHWKITKIKYSVTLRTEKALFYPEKNKYIGLENIEGWSNTLISTDTEYEHTFYSICKQGDVMYNKLRPNLGKVVIAPYDAFCTGELMIFPTFNGDKRFLRYWMSNTLFITEAIRSTYGAKMPRVNPDFILNMPIFLPDEEEQAFISNYLDKVCAEIEATIAEKRKQQIALTEYKKSLIYEYVTGKKEVPAP